VRLRVNRRAWFATFVQSARRETEVVQLARAGGGRTAGLN